MQGDASHVPFRTRLGVSSWRYRGAAPGTADHSRSRDAA